MTIQVVPSILQGIRFFNAEKAYKRLFSKEERKVLAAIQRDRLDFIHNIAYIGLGPTSPGDAEQLTLQIMHMCQEAATVLLGPIEEVPLYCGTDVWLVEAVVKKRLKEGK